MRHRKGNITVKKANGRIYFSKQTERRVFFYMTLAMLGAGIAARLL